MALTATAINTAIDDLWTAIENHIAGDPFVIQLQIGGRMTTYRSIPDATAAIKALEELRDSISAGSTASMVSYGRYRRNFR